MFARRLKGSSCQFLREALETPSDIMCQDLGETAVGDVLEYQACWDAYIRTMKALERRCVIVTTDTVFLFATVGMLGVIGLISCIWIRKGRKEWRVVR